MTISRHPDRGALSLQSLAVSSKAIDDAPLVPFVSGLPVAVGRCGVSRLTSEFSVYLLTFWQPVSFFCREAPPLSLFVYVLSALPLAADI